MILSFFQLDLLQKELSKLNLVRKNVDEESFEQDYSKPASSFGTSKKIKNRLKDNKVDRGDHAVKRNKLPNGRAGGDTLAQALKDLKESLVMAKKANGHNAKRQIVNEVAREVNAMAEAKLERELRDMEQRIQREIDHRMRLLADTS